MTVAEKQIIDTYKKLLAGLSSVSKSHILIHLTNSLEKENSLKEEAFYSSFGGFDPTESAEKIISQIKEDRKFKSKDLTI